MRAETRGFTELARDLAKASTTAQRKASQIVRRTAHAIERDAKILAPVDTGTLMNSISTTVMETGSSITTETGPTADYGHYVEEGTSRMAGQPYMGPATARRLPEMDAAFDRMAGDL